MVFLVVGFLTLLQAFDGSSAVSGHPFNPANPGNPEFNPAGRPLQYGNFTPAASVLANCKPIHRPRRQIFKIKKGRPGAPDDCPPAAAKPWPYP
jgi:hypothetical protein